MPTPCYLLVNTGDPYASKLLLREPTPQERSQATDSEGLAIFRILGHDQNIVEVELYLGGESSNDDGFEEIQKDFG